ncbi:MAG: site-2 protease family protein [Clostridia bacterium]|nr:site-2 protease family protein [Clostridia bacterium]
MITVLYILLALVVLLVLITVHEFGHYCAGKILGFKINEFSIGFGPAIYKKIKKNGEIFAVRMLPLGGYCAFEGEDQDGKNNPDAFNSKPGWKRIIVLLAGVTFNFLFGVLAAVIYLWSAGYSTAKVTTSLATSQLKQNDVVISVGGERVEAYRSFSSLVSKYGKDQNFVVTVDRNGEIVDINVSKTHHDGFYYLSDYTVFDGKLFTASGEKATISVDEFAQNIMNQSSSIETTESAGKGAAIKEYLSSFYDSADAETRKSYGSDEVLSQLLSNGTIVYAKEGYSLGMVYTNQSMSYNFLESLVRAFPFCFYLCGLILGALGGLFTGATKVSELGGTVTAISQVAEISQMGINYFLLLLPLLAMNLALFNVLPIPSLDGARVVFVLIEMIFRKPVPRQIEGWIHTVGLFVLLGLVIFLDVYHFFIAAHLLL